MALRQAAVCFSNGQGLCRQVSCTSPSAAIWFLSRLPMDSDAGGGLMFPISFMIRYTAAPGESADSSHAPS
ncbi:MAG: hypothetical protein RIS70_489 [Planctomycetota bacterium]|jgi:hypothetical protein